MVLAIVVNAEGTDRGLKRFYRGETDLATASRPIESKEMVACQAKGINFLELPIDYDAITVVHFGFICQPQLDRMLLSL